jgi:hypothetical protein
MQSNRIRDRMSKMFFEPAEGSLFVHVMERMLLKLVRFVIVNQMADVMKQRSRNQRGLGSLAFREQGALQRVLQLGDRVSFVPYLASILKQLKQLANG